MLSLLQLKVVSELYAELLNGGNIDSIAAMQEPKSDKSFNKMLEPAPKGYNSEPVENRKVLINFTNGECCLFLGLFEALGGRGIASIALNVGKDLHHFRHASKDTNSPFANVDNLHQRLKRV